MHADQEVEIKFGTETKLSLNKKIEKHWKTDKYRVNIELRLKSDIYLWTYILYDHFYWELGKTCCYEAVVMDDVGIEKVGLWGTFDLSYHRETLNRKSCIGNMQQVYASNQFQLL